MEAMLLLFLVFVMTMCLIGSIIYLLNYLGIFGKVRVSVASPVINNATIAYKAHTGAYKNCGPHFTEAYTLCPDLKCVGIYYDDPRTTPDSECRYAIGLILSVDNKEIDEKVLELVESRKFAVLKLPSIEHAVMAQFPFFGNICAWIGAWKVYPALNAFTKKRGLSAYPYLEIYDEGVIHYMAPLSKQDDFFVPEVKK